MSISLPRVSSAELLLFPETAEGHVSKVAKAMHLSAMADINVKLLHISSQLSQVVLASCEDDKQLHPALAVKACCTCDLHELVVNSGALVQLPISDGGVGRGVPRDACCSYSFAHQAARRCHQADMRDLNVFLSKWVCDRISMQQGPA